LKAYQYLTLLTGVFVFLVILRLVRRYRMHERYALWWLISALVVLIMGLLPRELDVIAKYFGVHYPPIFIVVVGLCIILVKLATMDIGRTRHELAIRRLAQQLALLEKKLEENTAGSHEGYRGEGTNQPLP
jgi:hypothetical protein